MNCAVTPRPKVLMLLHILTLCGILATGLLATSAEAFHLHSVPRVTLTVYVANSFHDAFDDFSFLYQTAHRRVRIKAVYGETQDLRAKIGQGARPDMFIAVTMPDTEQQGQFSPVSGSTIIACDRLCLIASPARQDITKLGGAGSPGVRLAVAAETSDTGRSTQLCWQRMAQAAAYGSAFVDAIKFRIACEAHDGGQVVRQVEAGQADVGFAYASEAFHHRVRAIGLPPDVSVRTTFTVVIANGREHGDTDDDFIGYMTNKSSAEVLGRHGLTSVMLDVSTFRTRWVVGRRDTPGSGVCGWGWSRA
jgi:ABC-type molybdate transport system substrate-binding protein